MGDGEWKYNRELAELLVDPYLHILREHIDKIRSPDTGVEGKREHVQDIEDLLTRGGISTRTSILNEFASILALLDILEVADEVCAMLGHISQNVPVLIDKLISLGMFDRLRGLYKKKESAVGRIVFLLCAISNGTKDFEAKFIDAGGKEFLCEMQQSRFANPTAQQRIQHMLASID